MNDSPDILESYRRITYILGADFKFLVHADKIIATGNGRQVVLALRRPRQKKFSPIENSIGEGFIQTALAEFKNENNASDVSLVAFLNRFKSNLGHPDKYAKI